MRRELRALLAISAAGAGLAACSDQPTSAPFVPRMAGVNADVLPACDFTTLRDAVRTYADVNGSDVIFDYIRDMSTDPYGQGMNGLARLAEIRAVGPKKAGVTAAQGAAAVTAFLACMPVGAVQTDFATNIVTAFGAGGMFEVPTTTSISPIFSRGEPANTQFWAAKPSGATTKWSDLTGGVRYLVFGYKINNGTGFDYNVVPMLGQGTLPNKMPATFTGSLLVGACGTFASNVRVKHVNEVLFDQSMGFCAEQGDSPPLAALSTGLGANFASLVRRSLSVFAPQPLYAAFGGGVGGAVSELSPTTLPSVAPKIEYAPQPANNKSVGDVLGIKVRVYTGATWLSGDPLNNAEVTLTVTGNSGQNAILLNTTTNTSCSFAKRTTINGVADFSDIAVTKSGGYTLTAEATWDNLPAAATLSNLFNVKNKKIGALAVACPA
jgi:hypothetical protein